MLDFSGQRIDRYYLIKRLGKGTFGEVYLAQDQLASTQGAYVAVKLLRHRLFITGLSTPRLNSAIMKSLTRRTLVSFGSEL